MTEIFDPIVLFDAKCVLCAANAQFLLRHDTAGRFRLASMQGAVGAQLFRDHGIDPSAPDTMIVIEPSAVRRDSDAVISIYEGLGWPWKAASALRLVPRPIRDGVYRWIARNRYRIFGVRETCWLPPDDLRDRVL